MLKESNLELIKKKAIEKKNRLEVAHLRNKF